MITKNTRAEIRGLLSRVPVFTVVREDQEDGSIAWELRDLVTDATIGRLYETGDTSQDVAVAELIGTMRDALEDMEETLTTLESALVTIGADDPPGMKPDPRRAKLHARGVLAKLRR